MIFDNTHRDLHKNISTAPSMDITQSKIKQHSTLSIHSREDILKPYEPSTSKPWNKERVIHLYRRLGMGPTPEEIKEALNMSPSVLVDLLLDSIKSSPLPERPYWAEYTDTDFGDDEEYYAARDYVRNIYYTEMVQSGLRSRLTLFWHNHFVTELDVYGCNKYLWSYFELLHKRCLGNFRSFVEEMGVNPAMLIYLDGNRNAVGSPNENYARELVELFTLGESNGYTQADIPNLARALTGYRANRSRCETPFFSNNHHDKGIKTIFGQSDNFNYMDVHELIFTLRANEVAGHISSKIFRNFVYTEVEQSAVSAMAQLFKESNWELDPLLRTLFKSELFFEEKWIGALICSPLDSLVKWSRSTGMNWADMESRRNLFRWGPYDQGMDLFNPINVAGWPGHRTWINESTFTLRIKDLLALNNVLNSDMARERLTQWAMSISADISDPNDIVRNIALELYGKIPEDYLIDRAIAVFKGDIPENYYEDGSWNLYWESAGHQLFNLLNYYARLPEAQLM